MPDLIDIGWVILGLVLLYYGAEWLVRGASELAIRFGISPLVVGLTVVAFGTSAPELVVSVKANFAGNGGMALGNVVGSNICNIALVLGCAAAIFPLKIHHQVIRREMPILIVISVIFAFMLRDGVISRSEGGMLFFGVLVYVYTSLRAAKKEPDCEVCEELDPEIIEAAKTGGAGRVVFDLLLVIVGCVVLVVGADRMVFGGGNIARDFGVSEAVIGLTLFAFGTSLPELATSVVAAFKKQGDIIVGNAVGSCIFNILAVVGMAGLIAPLEAVGVTSVHVGVMLVTVFLIMPMMWHRMKLDRWEGVVLAAGYFGFVGWLVVA
ncbi:calcium/sodium antiporter [Verrucomicrobiaceae bacterium 227]